MGGVLVSVEMYGDVCCIVLLCVFVWVVWLFGWLCGIVIGLMCGGFVGLYWWVLFLYEIVFVDSVWVGFEFVIGWFLLVVLFGWVFE